MGAGCGALVAGISIRRRNATALALAGLIILLAGVALLIGPYPLSAGEAASLVWSRLTGQGEAETAASQVLFSIRLPRVLAALLVGGALAAAGACYQSLFRNPLVSPDILGVSAGAGLGAVLGIFLSLPVAAIQLSAFVGGLVAVGAVGVVASAVRGRDTVLVLVLAGVVIGALAGAMTSLLKVMADPYDQLPAITFWLLGSLAAVQSGDVLAVLPAVLVGLVPMILLRWRIHVLALGDEEAKSLGIDAGPLRIAVIVCSTLMTASVVSIAGVIGWVGLVMPHIARMLVGPAFGILLPVATLLGAVYLLATDTMARTLTATEIPLGILTAVIGAPFFLWLLWRGRRGWA